MEIEFTPARGLPAVAEIAFEGTRVFSANELRNKIMQAAFGQPYSEPGFRAFLDREVRPLYEAKGYMGVAFPKLAAKPSERVQGLDVTVTVEEGTQYRLSGVSVTGPMSGDAERFRDMISAADFDKVRSGAERVKEQLRHEGYLDAQTSYTHRNNEAAKTVEAILDVQPGRKYTFGKLTVNGLGLDGEAAIRKMWIVRGGEPYPAGYHDLFASSVKQEGLFDNLGGIKASAAIDRKTHVVDVTLEFTARRR
jgi:outer membrane protein assembly factor BamA